MKVRQLVALTTLPFAAAAMAVASAGPAAAAPHEHARCAAHNTPGPARVGGAVVTAVAHGDRSDCVNVLLGILGP